MKHTKEPWIHGGDISTPTGGRSALISGKTWQNLATVVTKFDFEDDGIDPDEGTANLDRILKCVNAMKGIEDPELFVSQANQLKTVRADIFDATFIINSMVEIKDNPILKSRIDSLKRLLNRSLEKLK
jgi:hypothetical protein